MQRDELEKYIAEQRVDFDIHDLPEQVWPKIYQDLPDKKNSRFRFLKMAAVGLALITVGFGIGSFYFYNNDSHLADIAPPEFIETENYYAQQVATTYKEIKAIGGDENIDENLRALDEVYQELKSELLESKVNNREMILDAMIKTYQTKTELMEKILERLQEKKKYTDPKNNENEKIEI